MRLREYETYSDYLVHQMTKSIAIRDGANGEPGPFVTRKNNFMYFFRHMRPAGNCRALCLGARRGEEVSALRELGFDAIGLDLVAFPPLVHAGDMHDLPLWNESTSFVFSNSLDHAKNLGRVCGEIDRVLIPGGFVFLHLQIGKWSDEVANEIDNSGEVMDLFPGYSALKDHPLEPYGGGINHFLLLVKPN